MLQASLRVLSERQSGSFIPLPQGRFLIGREEDCHLRPNSELVSRHHCVFTNDNITLRLRDLGSTNGTFVNGERLKTAVVLKAGDRVSVGKLDFEVVIGDPAAAAGSAPVADAPGTSSDETQFAASAATETHTELPAFAPGMQQVGIGDTAMLPAGTAYPGAPGYPPPFAQPGYPYPGYAPMYPGYYMPNMPYPAMPGYPAQPAMPAQPAAPADDAVPEVRLPDPSTTGAKPPQPPAPKPEGQAAAPAGNVPDTAAGIIKQYLQRRPTTGK
jgi:predicted component of type VI protein secretion system